MATRIGPAVNKQEIDEILSNSAFARIYDFRVQSIGEGECVLNIPFNEAIERPGGIVAGSVFMTAADIAMWFAIMTKLGKDVMTVTTEMKTAFLSSATREDVLCTAKILKLGRTLIYGVAECNNIAGKLLTHHTITYIRTSR